MFANKSNALTVVLVVCCLYLAAFAKVTSADEEKSKKFDQAFEFVFAKNEGKHIKPEELRSLLNELWKTGSELERVDETIKVLELFALANLSPEQCEPDRNVFKAFRDAMAENWQYQVNVMPYLEHYNQKLTDQCEQILGRAITKTVLALGDSKMAHIIGMMSTIATFLPNQKLTPPIQPVTLAKGLSLVLKTRSNINWRAFSFNDGEKVDNAVYYEFGRLVEGPCLELTRKLGNAIDIYYSLPSFQSLESQAEWVHMIDWIKYGSVCLDIIGEMKQIESSHTIDLIEDMKFRLTGKRFQSKVGPARVLARTFT